MKRMLVNILVVFMSLSASVSMVEIFLRLIPNPPIPIGVPDAQLGYIYRSGLTQEGVNSESKEKVSLRVNSFGFRDDEWDTSARPDIMVVGDSFASAEGVDESKRFTELLEGELNANGWRGHVLNFGIAGSGPEAYIERIRKYVPIFDPDYVIVVIFNGNDLQNLNYDLTPATGRKNYTVHNGEVIAYSDIAGPMQKLEWNIKLLLGQSYFVQLVHDAWVKMHAPRLNSTEGAGGGTLPGYCDASPQDLDNSFTILQKLLEDMDKLSQHRLVVVSVPDKQQFRDDLPSACDPQLVEAQLSAITADLDIPFTALYPRFKELEPNTELYFAGHLNEKGHQVAADVLFEKLNQD